MCLGFMRFVFEFDDINADLHFKPDLIVHTHFSSECHPIQV